MENEFNTVISIGDLLSLIKLNKTIYHDVRGEKYEFPVVRILQTPLGELLRYINEGNYFYKGSSLK